MACKGLHSTLGLHSLLSLDLELFCQAECHTAYYTAQMGLTGPTPMQITYVNLVRTVPNFLTNVGSLPQPANYCMHAILYDGPITMACGDGNQMQKPIV